MLKGLPAASCPDPCQPCAKAPEARRPYRSQLLVLELKPRVQPRNPLRLRAADAEEAAEGPPVQTQRFRAYLVSGLGLGLRLQGLERMSLGFRVQASGARVNLLHGLCLLMRL